MPVFSLRLPETLEADARAKAAQLGISINALVCVAVDAYLRGGGFQPITEPLAPSPTIPPASTPITALEPITEPLAPSPSPALSKPKKPVRNKKRGW